VCNLKEVKNTLRIAFEHVQDLGQAIALLQQMVVPASINQPVEKE
jgi:hypothetical protein